MIKKIVVENMLYVEGRKELEFKNKLTTLGYQDYTLVITVINFLKSVYKNSIGQVEQEIKESLSCQDLSKVPSLLIQFDNFSYGITLDPELGVVYSEYLNPGTIRTYNGSLIVGNILQGPLGIPGFEKVGEELKNTFTLSRHGRMEFNDSGVPTFTEDRYVGVMEDHEEILEKAMKMVENLFTETEWKDGRMFWTISGKPSNCKMMGDGFKTFSGYIYYLLRAIKYEGTIIGGSYLTDSLHPILTQWIVNNLLLPSKISFIVYGETKFNDRLKDIKL